MTIQQTQIRPSIVVLVVVSILSSVACKLFFRPPDVFAAKEPFYDAEAHYNGFVKDPEAVKYRDNWLVCVRKFRAAYETNPTGDLASASLFMIGSAYEGLWRRSGISSDRREAVDTYKRLIKRFPESAYAERARTALSEMDDGDSGEKSRPVPHLSSRSTKSEADEGAPPLPAAKRPVAKQPKADTPEASVPFKRMNAEARASKDEYRASLEKSPASDISDLIARKERPAPEAVPVASEPTQPPSGESSVIEGLRVWSNPNYTRIVVDADKDTPYTHKLLDKDRAVHKPQRLYIDFSNSRLGKDIDTKLPINDNLLNGARAGQWNPDTVRVVVDIKSFKTYKVFSLKNPFRTIIDVWGSEAGTQVAERTDPIPKPRSKPAPKLAQYEAAVSRTPMIGPDEKFSPHDLARQLALGVRRIVIDAGHGGKDPGAPGYFKGIKEKDIVLQIARQLKTMIERELGCEVIMTRDSDRFLTLEERTAIANTKNADLFISIHCNATPGKTAYGIETYFLNFTTDEDAIQVAARENATSRKNISDLQTILNDLMKNAKINESSRLATHVQNHLVRHMTSRYSKINDKGVKQAPFYVLIGAQMPSILIETSFISNKRECQRLLDKDYQENLCRGIVNGIRRYIEENSPTALLRKAPDGKG